MATLCVASASGCSALVKSARSTRYASRPSVPRSRVVRVQAAVKPPQGVSLPPQEPQAPPPMFGFVDWAEKINGRAAMLGFFALLLVEAVSGKGLLEVFGLTIGQGLGFEL
eukprot:CAMPEP_0202868168 /NCGR_PEP_ID=MMETSP1391-20130828/10339_1 /ASSEMBLY_ACC=CAM_ASM_000867 /TAXON_ID=1034604 /ORGANISM="Chlamydomonas leiostraca, Strain SAG 11-49" /LENGTH=110 /DNA_ID=CAMNT_0049548291 /DNA_START=30 /DNA_END=362 /DNA_ORIENTATION=+